MALAHLRSAGIAWTGDLPCVRATPSDERRILERQLDTRLNCVDTSSMGRLFDAAASLLDVRQIVTYEAQGAMELENIADLRTEDAYCFGIDAGDELIFDPAPLWRAMVADLRRGVSPPVIAARFHRAVSNLIVELCTAVRERHNIRQVALSGGVFQNVLLLDWAKSKLLGAGFDVLTHHLVPPNDGGLALGQAVIARAATL
jgi:hydrogenase maturation protein HypF